MVFSKASDAQSTAADKLELEANCKVSRSALKAELEDSTIKAWGGPCDKAVRALIAMEPNAESCQELLEQWQNSEKKWNCRMKSQFDNASARGTVRFAFMQKVIGLLNVTLTEEMKSNFRLLHS